jgi:3-oxoacyl-[acyl-carrier protein] reductase
MDLNINGKSAIICASSKGLGKACALALARENVNVVICGRHQRAAYITAQNILMDGGLFPGTL